MAFRKNKVKLVWNNNFAYVIGVIATDGNLSPDQRHICITSKDYEMVVNCRKCLKIKNNIGRKARGGSEEKKYFILQFGDKNFFEFLLKIGITPRKSKTISDLKIPVKYFPHFFRGCLDGDGSLTIFTHPESKHLQYTLRICSASKNFTKWMLEESRKAFPIKGGSVFQTRKTYMHILRFGKEDSVKILKLIYPKNVICLSRKKIIADKMLSGK
ncbi:hypothetical protein A2642_04400 [Candidatus Nomurabacteria bacterium RIFCSPHIGHO2_01_FULL_39_10]|uniref:Homing endonuclease LAGLIDADG domain-containing protein n=1 Tax=Candidatus Nomurabacteria bacterium RIFCSPHIGHO2_01_FULL_39_10 TaxID=1801733 RepID=A0A1F6V4H3_9BACT|nr:MAG: hypothetical protein A2642_04400 [Candidatus Nomurabacteria bacterium RIFCSPHIGHO2_01_FULL_39_10]